MRRVLWWLEVLFLSVVTKLMNIYIFIPFLEFLGSYFPFNVLLNACSLHIFLYFLWEKIKCQSHSQMIRNAKTLLLEYYQNIKGVLAIS